MPAEHWSGNMKTAQPAEKNEWKGKLETENYIIDLQKWSASTRETISEGKPSLVQTKLEAQQTPKEAERCECSHAG